MSRLRTRKSAAYDERINARSGSNLNTLTSRHLLLVGYGGLGANLAQLLSGYPWGSITVVDPELAELSNLGRTPFGLDDVGKPKVAHVRRVLARSKPSGTRWSSYHGSGQQLLVENPFGFTAIVAAVDNDRSRLQLQRSALSLNLNFYTAGLEANQSGRSGYAFSRPAGEGAGCIGCWLLGVERQPQACDAPESVAHAPTVHIVASILADMLIEQEVSSASQSERGAADSSLNFFAWSGLHHQQVAPNPGCTVCSASA